MLGRQRPFDAGEPLVLGVAAQPGARVPGALPHRIDPPPPVGIDPRVNRAVQHAGDRGAGRALPHDLALERAGPHPDPYLNALLHEIAHHPLDRADLGELREDQPHHGLDLLVRMNIASPEGQARIARPAARWPFHRGGPY